MQHMVCVSREVRQHAIDKERICESKLSIIPNGIHDRWLDDKIPAVDWSELRVENSGNVLLFVGRLEPQKGLVELSVHLPELMNALPGWTLVLMGQGSLRSTLEKRIRAAKLTERVHLVGWQPSALPWMKASQILILPAVYEGMPNVLLEAMALQRPVVSFAVDGVRQLMEKADGYPAHLADVQLAEPGAWPQFVERLKRLANDDALRQSCGAANKQHVAKHFRLDLQLAKYVELYLQVSATATTK
jgi:glycosyltransferase involved in cell wall biosynthesis